MHPPLSFRQLVAAAALGGVGAAAFPPLGLWPLIFVSLAGLLWLLSDATGANGRLLAIIYGMAYAAGTMYWMVALFGGLAVGLMALMGVYLAVLAAAVTLSAGLRPWWRALLVAVVAVGIEWLRGDAWYLRFPWYTPPHALAQSPAMIASARWLGVYGLSGVVWFLAAWLAFAERRSERLAAVLGLLLLPAASLALPGFDAPNQTAILAQGEGWDRDRNLPAAAAVALEASTEPADIVVLPELAYHEEVETVLAARSAFHCRAERGRGRLRSDTRASRQCVAWTGRVAERRPGACPWWRTARLLRQAATGPPVQRRRGGQLLRRVRLGRRSSLGRGICYDFDGPAVAAGLTSAGATVLAYPTADMISWGRMQHVHHELLTRLRAVENDRWVLRAASSGRTEVIDPHGRPSGNGLEFAERGHLRVEFGHRHSWSLGGRMHWLGPISAVAGCLVLVGLFLRRRQQGRAGATHGSESAN